VPSTVDESYLIYTTLGGIRNGTEIEREREGAASSGNGLDVSLLVLQYDTDSEDRIVSSFFILISNKVFLSNKNHHLVVCCVPVPYLNLYIIYIYIYYSLKTNYLTFSFYFCFLSGKGGKNRRRGKGDGEESKRELEFKEDGTLQ
jgi:hypothetical protein